MSRTDAILGRLLALYPKLIDLQLGRQLRLLEKMGNPHQRLPPVIHVAGTNGKGSTVAFLRAFLEASGKRVHVFTSPHLVRFNERIRLSGRLISSRKLNAALEEAEALNGGEPITFFEITTAVALKLFAEVPADYLLLETGMGGEFDSTNVITQPLGTVITPIALDHQQFLGDTTGKIAVAKAGILKKGSKAVFARQPDGALETLTRRAAKLGIRPFIGGQDFDGYAQDGRLVYQDEDGLLDLPPPALLGAHQFENAAVAIAAVRHFGLPVSEVAIAEGLRKVSWPARLSPLKGKLRAMLPRGAELWLDGGHNAHGAAALAAALQTMNRARPKPLVIIMGMMNTRAPKDFLAAFPDAKAIFALTIPGEKNAHKAAFIAGEGRKMGLPIGAKRSVTAAVAAAARFRDARVVICGSLYLAGDVLVKDGSVPD